MAGQSRRQTLRTTASVDVPLDGGLPLGANTVGIKEGCTKQPRAVISRRGTGGSLRHRFGIRSPSL